MSKSLRNVFNKHLTFEKMLSAHYRACKGKKDKREVILFEMNLEKNIYELIYLLDNELYKLGKYREFTIYEPKKRLIRALPYRDRVVQQWYIEEFIKPFYVKRFDVNTYACIKNRGTHACVSKTQAMLRHQSSNAYVLKCDIKKYFYSINQDILFDILSNNILDKKLLSLTKLFIYDGEGIAIGNYTSQYFANIYLNELDKYIKSLGVKYYIRYMDDFILFGTKEECRKLLNLIIIYLKIYLNLELNPNSRYYPHEMGINFCGYIIFNNYRLIRKRSILKMKKGFNSLLSYNSWINHCSHANTYNLINKYKLSA